MPKNILPKDPFRRIQRVAKELFEGSNESKGLKKKQTIASVARKFGVAQGTVNVDAWLYKNLSVESMHELSTGRLTYAKARILAAYSAVIQNEYLSHAIKKDATEKQLRDALESKVYPRVADDGFTSHPETQKTAEMLSALLGVAIDITRKKGLYQLEAKYISNERALRALIALNVMNETIPWDSVFTGYDATTREPKGKIILRFDDRTSIVDYLTKVSELTKRKNTP